MHGYILDFYAAKIKLAIEIDGSQHYEDANYRYDHERDKILTQHGITTVRYTNYEINCELVGVLENIYHKVECRLRMVCAKT